MRLPLRLLAVTILFALLAGCNPQGAAYSAASGARPNAATNYFEYRMTEYYGRYVWHKVIHWKVGGPIAPTVENIAYDWDLKIFDSLQPGDDKNHYVETIDPWVINAEEHTDGSPGPGSPDATHCVIGASDHMVGSKDLVLDHRLERPQQINTAISWYIPTDFPQGVLVSTGGPACLPTTTIPAYPFAGADARQGTDQRQFSGDASIAPQINYVRIELAPTNAHIHYSSPTEDSVESIQVKSIVEFTRNRRGVWPVPFVDGPPDLVLNSPDAANGKPATIHLPALPASGSLSVVEDDSIFAPDLAPSGASTGGSHAGTPDPLSAPPPISAPVFAASGAAQVTAGQPITLVMRPTAAGAALLSRPHPLIHVDYVLTFRPTSGTAQTLTLGGIIPTTIPDPYVPVITGVAFHGTAANPRIVVTGTGFGTAPAPDPPYVASGHSYCPAVHGVAGYDYGTSLYITTPNLSAGRYRPELNELDCVGLIVQRYTPTEVEFTPDVAYQDPVYSKGRLMAGAPYTISVNSASFSGKVAYTP